MSRSNVRWVVRPADARTVAGIMQAAGFDEAAIGAGRVFVGRRRVLRGDEAVVDGDEVRVTIDGDAAPEVKVIFRDRDWLVLDKPAGLVTIPDHGGAESLLAAAARLCGAEPASIHTTSRLDRDVSGVVTFALTKRARDMAQKARENGAYERRYVAIAAGADVGEGTWSFPIGRARDRRLRQVNGQDATSAETVFRVAGAASGFVLLALAPLTGRTHQLRVHASHAGLPLVGDRAYGGPVRVALPSGKVINLDRIALHAAWVKVDTGRKREFRSQIPEELTGLWSTLGGDPTAWDIAVSCALGGR